MKKVGQILLLISILALSAPPALAIDQASTLIALRLAYTITGGLMPSSDPLIAQMVTQIQAGNTKGAALIAAKSKYFANYLAKRLAYQMQTPALDATTAVDSDGTAFLIAHFTGAAGIAPSISTIWSENQTYLVNVPISGVPTPTHANQVATNTGFTISPLQIDWSSQLVTGGPQMAILTSSDVFPNTPVYTAIGAKHIGGYATASTQAVFSQDTSFANYGAYNGTNLRMIEGIWEIATGMTLVDVEDTNFAATTLAQAEAVPRFIPEMNSNFFVGQGQAACIACHGGGMSALAHGFATVADVFDYTPNAGFSYQDPTTAPTATRKSLGSNPLARTHVLACNLALTPTLACNPDSPGVDPNQAWDLSSWQKNGTLNAMGWTGPVTGQGLNQLGVAIGQASIVYEFLTKRVIKEICPVGAFTASDVANIANAANPYAIVPGTDDIATIIALVATNSTCL